MTVRDIQPTVVAVHDLRIRDSAGAAVLDGVTLTARAGELVAVTGASGSGKTTLLRACSGALAPAFTHAGGDLRVLGEAVFQLPPHRLRHLRRTAIRYVGQDPSSRLNPRMSIGHLLRETAHDRSHAAIRDLLTRLRLPATPDLLRRRPGQVSGGQARRVALARALAGRPALLLLDEPTAGLDPTLRDELTGLLRELAREENIAVVVACHDPQLTAGADQVITVGGVATPHASGPVAVDIAVPQAADQAGHRLIIRDLQLRAGRRRLLDGASITLPTGTMTGLIGASGSGKTTLARAITGLHPPEQGLITLDGDTLAARVTRRSRDQRRRIQFVPQDPLGSLNPARTVAQTLTRPLRLHRTTGLGVAELLRMTELPAHLAGRYPHELSGGQRQRVALARALAARPDVLVCDEITSALDGPTAARLLDLLDRLRRQARLTILLITHDHALAGRYCDTIASIAEGRLGAMPRDRDVAGTPPLSR